MVIYAKSYPEQLLTFLQAHPDDGSQLRRTTESPHGINHGQRIVRRLPNILLGMDAVNQENLVTKKS